MRSCATPPTSTDQESSRATIGPSASSQTPISSAAIVARFKRIGASAAAMNFRWAFSMPLSIAVSDMQMR